MFGISIRNVAVSIVFGIAMAFAYFTFLVPYIASSTHVPELIVWGTTAFIAAVMAAVCCSALESNNVHYAGQYGIVVGVLTFVVLLAGAFAALVYWALATYVAPVLQSFDYDVQMNIALTFMVGGGILFTVVFAVSLYKTVSRSLPESVAGMFLSAAGAAIGVAIGYFTGTTGFEGLAIWGVGGLAAGLALTLMFNAAAKHLRRRRFAS